MLMADDTTHNQLADALGLPENAILTAWCITYEYRTTDDDAAAGYAMGPETVTLWQAIGLLEWARLCMNESIGDT